MRYQGLACPNLWPSVHRPVALVDSPDMLKPATGPPASGPTIQSDAETAERRRAHLASVRYQHPTEELEEYKREHGLRGYKEAAAEIGCAESTVQRWLRDGRLEAVRYPGPWAGNPPVLFSADAIDAGRELLADAYRGRGERMAAKWADGRITGRPRQGVINECPVCGKPRYRKPSDAEKKCCSDLHAQIDRWRRGVGVHGLVKWLSGPARRKWKLKWVPRPGRPRNDARLDYEDALERIRDEYARTNAPERELQRLTGESRRMIRIALSRPV